MQIKNTFVHLDLSEVGADTRGAERRSSSVPRSLRLASICSVNSACEEGGRAPSVGSAEISTEAELSSEGGSFAEDFTPPPSPKITARQPEQVDLQAVASPPAPMPHPAGWETSPGPAGTTPLRRLNSKAQAWTPGASSRAGYGVVPATMGYFLQQLAAVVSAAAGSMKSSCTEAAVEAVEGPAGWSIVIEMPLADLQTHRDKVLSLACQALLQAARNAQGIHVLGSMASPFVATPFGCSAMVGAVCDENKACWDALARGFCHRGRACRWEHPVCRSTVNIMVKIAEGK